MKYFLNFILVVILAPQLLAQSPNSFNYQAVIRDANGLLLKNSTVSLRISILEESGTGSTIYQESHTATTNEYGLVNTNIGEGSVLSGTFADIAWDNAAYFINVSLDLNGGTTYTDMGTQHLTSVPYSLHAKTVEFSDNDTTNEIQTLSQTGNTVTLSNSGGSINIADLDSDPANEIQDLSSANGTLSLS
jgi:hypothetical protein